MPAAAVRNLRAALLVSCASIVFRSGAIAAPSLTFGHDIAPIVYRRCASCHRPGEAGPFPLLTYSDVYKRARQIAEVTRSRYMPPWLPEAGYGEFADEQRLTDAEIKIISEWVAQGAAEGPPDEVPPPPDFAGGWQLGVPDLVLEAPAPFQLPASGPDVYWNFVFQPRVDAVRYVRAIEVRPGDRKLVHHANLLIDRLGSSKLDGFPGMDVVLLRSPFDPEGHFLFWKPGAPPPVEPDGFSWRLDPGNQLVLNTHMHPSGKPEQVRPSIGLYFTDKPPARFPLLVELDADRALDIPPGAADFVVHDDFQVPMDVDVLAVYPHAHYLGKLLEAYATLPDGRRRWLIRIPAWDPAWQAVYRCREPVFLPKGASITMRYHYDNSAANVRNPKQPPRRVRAGNQSSDEMAHLTLQLLPRGAGDRRRELEEAVMRHRLEKAPGDFEASFNLGVVLLSRANARDAVGMLQTAVRADPGRSEAHNMLGLALAATGRNAEAIAEYEAALHERPDYLAAHMNLANALLKAGRLDEAIEGYRRVLAAYPDDPRPKDRLVQALHARARQLAREEKWDRAAAMYRELVALAPNDESVARDFEEFERAWGNSK